MNLSAREISLQDIKAIQSNHIQYSPAYFKHLPPGTTTHFEWKDYCPSGFRILQELEDIDQDAYTLLIRSDEIIKRISVTKPGSLFRLPEDDRFIIKVLRKSEIKVILDFLPRYCHHIQKYRSTRLCKIYSAHAVNPDGGAKAYFGVFQNLLRSDKLMDRIYDLKGSLPRRAGKVKVGEKAVLKDSDLDFCFYLDPLTRHRLLKQIKLDCEMLENEGIMDYSLFLGFHMKRSQKESFDSASVLSGKTSSFNSSNSPFISKLAHSSPLSQVSRSSIDSKSSDSSMKVSTDLKQESNETEQDVLLETNNTLGMRFGSRIPARAVRVARGEGGIRKKVGAEECYDVMLYFGIVDSYQSYNVMKKIEHCYKSIHMDSRSMTAVNPKIYSSRFQEFLKNILLEERPEPDH